MKFGAVGNLVVEFPFIVGILAGLAVVVGGPEPVYVGGLIGSLSLGVVAVSLTPLVPDRTDPVATHKLVKKELRASTTALWMADDSASEFFSRVDFKPYIFICAIATVGRHLAVWMTSALS
ncbi:MAG: hypothetical protein AAGJ55_08190 [Cyanobacteria bacterium J06555_12]